ncbi:MAG: hypothetical protein WB681_10325 [Candidatus Cybelea sp.]
MLRPKSLFKTEAQIAEEKANAEFAEAWRTIPPQPGRLEPRKPAFDDARLVSREELEREWRCVARNRVK